MIRRRVGDEFWLITQHDHALLAGELAKRIGNRLFEVPRERHESFLLAVAMHDCGWPVHDDRPTLNSDHLPIDVFESTREIALSVWPKATERMLAQSDDYATLLVSLHVLALSAFATSTSVAHPLDLSHAKTRFEVNRFQHKQIELQESLRRKLGLPVDVAMERGLAVEPMDPAEQLLQFHFRMLQAMDLISLGLCCTKPPAERTGIVFTRPGGKTVNLTIRRKADTSVTVSTWPFDREPIQAEIGYRPVPARAYPDDAEFAGTYSQVSSKRLQFELFPG